MKQTGISPDQVIAIIDAVKGSRISVLKYRGLHIEQRDEVDSPGQWTSQALSQVALEAATIQNTDPTPPVAFSSNPAQPVGSASELTEDDRLEMVKLEDPEEYELLLEKRELENAGTDDDIDADRQ